MKCVICKTTIGNRETRAYVTVYRNGKPWRKIFACSACSACSDGQFDRLIDALPVDSDDNPLDVSHAELQALILATDCKRLEKRLRKAHSCLITDLRLRFGQGRFDFENRCLIGNNGVILQWRTRDKPNEPIAYRNQQTTEGTVSYRGNKIIIVTGCRENCPYTNHYNPNEDGETLGCCYAYGTLPKQGVAEWCPLHDKDL